MELDSPYLENVYTPARLKKIVARVSKKLKKLQKKLKFDAIAFTGSSGAAVAFPVSYVTGIRLIHVRKKEPSHGIKIEGTGRVKRYIMLDDFIDCGDTVRRIYKQIRTDATGWYEEPPECVGAALYCRDGGSMDNTVEINSKTEVRVFSV